MSKIVLLVVFMSVLTLPGRSVAMSAPAHVYLPTVSIPAFEGRDVAGTWRGSLFQGTTVLPFDVTFAQHRENLRGTSTIKNGMWYAIMELVGAVEGDVVRFDETRIIETNGAGFFASWCIKSVTLTLSDLYGTQKLEGPWAAPSCPSGTVRLFRQ